MVCRSEKVATRGIKKRKLRSLGFNIAHYCPMFPSLQCHDVSMNQELPSHSYCPANDWLHEWPWEALPSSSRRFTEEAEGVEVEDLKSKLATQETDWQLKNKDTLIAQAGFQTEKLSQEKAIADAEELKFSLSALVISICIGNAEAHMLYCSPQNEQKCIISSGV
ncbi:hypothetical protein Nmel_000422 [Mimus melanotis]